MATRMTAYLQQLWSRQAWPLMMAGAAILLYLMDARPSLAYDRAAIAQGEYWRLLTAHLVHLGFGHLVENLAGLTVVAVLCGGQLAPRHWAIATLVIGVAISLALYLLMPTLAWYVGLSGVLYGLLVAGLAIQLRRHASYGMNLTLLALVAVKIGWEQVGGPLPGSVWLTGGEVITASHLYGAISGLVVALVWPSRSLAGH